MKRTIVVTDLDGTLLHPVTYSAAEAAPALDMLRKKGIPLVLCSSKTRSEIEVWRRRLDNEHPFVTENGGGIFVPPGYFPFSLEGTRSGDYIAVILGTPYAMLRREFTSLRDELKAPVKGFGDMTADDVARLTGLSAEEAVRAKERDFDEPFVFEASGADEKYFLQAIEDRGYSWTKGQFYHLTGKNDKGRATMLLREWYEKEYGPVSFIGLGDSLNDLPLLRAVDLPVLVRRMDGTHAEGVELPGLVRSDGVGPVGWNREILRILGA